LRSDGEATRTVLGDVLRWSRERDYRGHSKHDALNSPFLSTLSCGNRFLRLAVTQAVMRFPLNTRSLFGVPRLRNPKGIGLFAHAWLDLAGHLHRHPGEGGRISADECRGEAEELLSWLVRQASPQARPSAGLREAFGAGGELPSSPGAGPLKGLGWGYHYDWQDKGFFQPAHFPNRVVSCWIGFAFLRAFEITGDGKYLAASREIASFLLDNPRRIVETADQLCLSYVPLEDIDWAVMDVSALVAAFCSKLAHLEEEETGLLADARRLMEFVVRKQTDYGAWFYTWPAGDSHIRHDNYHTGIILDCLADYMTYSGDHSYRRNYLDGLDYYRRHLFLENGAPRWMNDRTWPLDVHGSAAGILAFTRASRYFAGAPSGGRSGEESDWLEFAGSVAKWTLENLYRGRGYFFYQKTRWMTKRFCLMRWCNAWMCRALAYHLGGGAAPDTTRREE
jgi:hypothetical protein